ncbi:MAG TPA: cation:proton antiporter, partial [Bacillota bacterium]|nr:cation:proton antiporter [Bacillota bacterium]
AVGLIGLVYVLFRVVGKWLGAWLGSRVTHAEQKISRYLGWTLIPQAGVAIGLSLIASQVLDADMGAKIRAIILTATLVYELVGPLITKTALQKAGEIAAES